MKKIPVSWTGINIIVDKGTTSEEFSCSTCYRSCILIRALSDQPQKCIDVRKFKKEHRLEIAA